MPDSAIPAETRLSMYLSARLLQELETALLLTGLQARYERPGIDGIMLPRLRVTHPRHGEMDEAVCAIPRVSDARGLSWDAPDPQWWFMWWERRPATWGPVCPAVDMTQAAHQIAARVHGSTA